MPNKQEHRCDKWPEGYTNMKISFYKEAISGWNWNFMFQSWDDKGMWDCYHITYCPFCGLNLDRSLDEDAQEEES